MREIFKSEYRSILFGGLLVYILTAIFSIGYLHPDEHFQILEFCQYKLGKSPIHDLPWEFNAKIRPAIQPLIAYGIIKFLNLIQIQNPFIIAFILRLLSGLLCWFVTSKLTLLLMNRFKTTQGKRLFILTNFFLWFIPFLSVRFSSENFGSISLLFALIVLFNISEKSNSFLKYIVFGLLLGLSFFFRFQMGFAILGIAAWLILIRRLELQKLLLIFVGGITSITLGTYIDYWFYGEWVCTPYNYFFSNIIQNKAAEFGTEPIWFYFSSLFVSAIPPISITLFIFFFIGIKNNFKDLFVWILVPFVIAHSLVGHKELRFLFPMLFAFVYLCALGVDHLVKKNSNPKKWNIVLRTVVLINFPILLFRCILPAQESVAYYRFVYNQYYHKNTIILGRENELYYLKANFYKTPDVQSVQLENDTSIQAYLRDEKPQSILLFESELKNGNIQYAGYTHELVFCFFPEWILNINLNNWQNRSHIWSIWELKRIAD
ncbi:MAG TPA: hypothetical protein PL185_12420 [Flavobacteriales bacterium]|nr:hypothetical protein [Flavobacteriales bacterium]